MTQDLVNYEAGIQAGELAMARKLFLIIEVAAWILFIILVGRWAGPRDVPYEPWSLLCGGVGCGLELYRGYTSKRSAGAQREPRRRWRVTISGLLGLIALLAVLFAQVSESFRREVIRLARMESGRREAIKIATERAGRLFPWARQQDFAVDAQRVAPEGTWMVVFTPKSGARANTYRVHIREDRNTERGILYPPVMRKGRSPIKALAVNEVLGRLEAPSDHAVH
jgi:hypothetical protein